MFLSLFLAVSFAAPARANLWPDADHDGVPDKDEIGLYHTDPHNPDTDGDGYSDFIELNSGYSPLNPAPVKLADNDYDHDGLSDKLELAFGSNLAVSDTDGDGYTDGAEIAAGYNPLDPQPSKLPKRIEVNTAAQELSYFLGGVRLGVFPISSGVPAHPTPKGWHIITNKALKAWSPYGLWMPYWLGLDDGRVGIHELPYWPGGQREGEDQLGRPVSHGCIRLGLGAAEKIYNWAEIGTPVFVY